MQEQRSRYDDGDQSTRKGRRTALTPLSVSDTTLIDLRDAPARPAGGRRFAPYLIPESDRDALAAVALAAYQTSTQTPSVLDVDAAQLRASRARPRRDEPVEPQWTPPVLAVEEPVTTLAVRSEGDFDAERRKPRVSPRGRWLAGAAAVGLVALLGGGIGSMLREREDQAVAPQTASVVPGAVADPALLPDEGLGAGGTTSGQPPVASVEGKLTLSEATLHDRLVGASAPASTVFPAGAEIILYLGYASWQPEPDDRLGVIWLREGAEVGRGDVELIDGSASNFIAAPPLEPGPYRADVTLNDEVVASVPFEVVAP